MNSDDDDSATAAEFVMGLLDKEDQAVAEQRMTTDAAFAKAVSAWQERLSDFDASVDPVAPSPMLWDRIAEATRSAPAKPERFARSIGYGATLWDSIMFWRTTAIAGTFAALLMAVVAINARNDLFALAQHKPIYVALLVNETNKETGAVVNAFADGRVQLIPLKPIDVPKGRTLQVWTLWDRAIGPKSIGLTGQLRTLLLNLESLPETVQDQLFEITLEPEGGSPTGRPTGPILLKGNAARAL